MTKLIFIFAVSLMSLPHAIGQESKDALGLVWSGPTEHESYRALAKESGGVKFRTGTKANSNEIQVRAMGNLNYIEVFSKRSHNWVQLKIPKNANVGSVDTARLVQLAFFISNCDQVKTIIELEGSTPKTEMHFNSKPIGPVKDNGRFYYESEGVCRDSTVELLGTLQNCKDSINSFNAENNPQVYKGKAVPDCSKKSASNY